MITYSNREAMKIIGQGAIPMVRSHFLPNYPPQQPSPGQKQMLPHNENANLLKVLRREKGHSQLKKKALNSMMAAGRGPGNLLGTCSWWGLGRSRGK